MFSVDAYLRRLDLDPHTGPPSVELLAALQLAHLVHVPFENLHVYHRRGTRTDAEWSIRKIVEQRRGGWCFEVNGAFGTLLRALGFTVDHVSCQVWEAGREEWGPDLDHLGTIVHLDGARWFVDVGFGDCCIQPLLVETGERPAVPRAVRLDVAADSALLTELMPADEEPAGGRSPRWEPQLTISFRPRDLREFEPRSRHLQTYPGLSWQEKAFATRALDATGSRVTLRSDRLRRREGVGAYVDEPVSPDDWPDTLLGHFGLSDTLAR